jgi:PLP dependent protein
MPVQAAIYRSIKEELDNKSVTLIAVSKTKPIADIQELYDAGHRHFGENYVQELVDKYEQLPKDIHWHFIGHLQSNKVKYIAPFVHLIHGVDSMGLLKEINKQSAKHSRIINCLLQVHIAQEETKFGLNEAEVNEIMKEFENSTMPHVRICGLMGMASFTDDLHTISNEFKKLKEIFVRLKPLLVADCPLPVLSMGMSSDYKIAIEEGSTMVRIGSLLFGERTKT